MGFSPSYGQQSGALPSSDSSDLKAKDWWKCFCCDSGTQQKMVLAAGIAPAPLASEAIDLSIFELRERNWRPRRASLPRSSD